MRSQNRRHRYCLISINSGGKGQEKERKKRERKRKEDTKYIHAQKKDWEDIFQKGHSNALRVTLASQRGMSCLQWTAMIYMVRITK